MCSLYLGDQIISGQATLVGESRNIGQIIPSTIPLTDAGLHLLDGSLINGGGIYSAFVDYIAELYSEEEVTWTQPTLTSNSSYGIVSSNSVHSGHEAFRAFDGIKTGGNKYLSGSTTSGDITWQMPQYIKITSCKVYQTDEASYLNRFPKTITLQGSNDGNNWTDLGTASGYSQPTSLGYIEVTVANPSMYSNYRWLFGESFGGNSGVAISEIKITATYTKTPNFFTTEASWQSSVATYGACGKFVYDSTNNTVRLPKITGIIEGTTDATALGDLVEAGLPNITGRFLGNEWAGYDRTEGAFYNSGTADKGSEGGDSRSLVYLDASRSSSIYGNSSTVQPQTIKALYYIVVATSTKTDIQVDIDQVATDLNKKVDRGDLQEVQCVVETYQNGASWYRVYSDGWCEQGGTINTSADAAYTVTLLKPFANTNYQVFITRKTIGDHSSNINGRWAEVYNVTTTTFTTWGKYSSHTEVFWQACGYIEV